MASALIMPPANNYIIYNRQYDGFFKTFVGFVVHFVFQ